MSAFCPAARAAIITYTDEATFLAALEPSPFVEDFSSLTPNDSITTGTFSGPGVSGPFSFEATANGDLYVLSSGTFGGGNWLSTAVSNQLLVITITGSAVTGFGGFPFLTALNAAPITSGTMLLTLNGTASYPLVDPSPTGFFGIVSSDPITSVTLEYLGLENLFVTAGPITMGVAVPEPGTLALAGCGLGGAAALGMRRRRQRERGDAAAGRRPPADFGREAGGSTNASRASPV
jgi:hypothetical protein